MKTFKQLREEMSAGSGAIAGIGVGEQGEPPVDNKKRKLTFLRRNSHK